MRVLELSTKTMKEKFIISPSQLKEALDATRSELMLEEKTYVSPDEFNSFRGTIEDLEIGESVTVGEWNFLVKEMDEASFNKLRIFPGEITLESDGISQEIPNEKDLIDNGVLCHQCGSFIGDAIGQQRLCEDCEVLSNATEEK